MHDLMSTSIAFFVMLNPFAIFVILEPLRRNMDRKNFCVMLMRASTNSALIFIMFYLAGDIIFTKIFQIDFEAFRIFGGIVIFSFAYLYVVKEHRTLIQHRESINDLAINVSVPFMVGAGTISLAVLLAEISPNLPSGIAAIVTILTANHLAILGLGKIRVALPAESEQHFDRYMDVAMKINIFMIGAIGVNMVITGLRNLLM